MKPEEVREELDLLSAKIDILADEINLLKEAKPQEEEKIKMLDGGLR